MVWLLRTEGGAEGRCKEVNFIETPKYERDPEEIRHTLIVQEL